MKYYERSGHLWGDAEPPSPEGVAKLREDIILRLGERPVEMFQRLGLGDIALQEEAIERERMAIIAARVEFANIFQEEGNTPK